MPEEVIIHKNRKLIEIISYGDVTKEDIDKSLQSIGQIYKKYRISNVLVDAREETSLPDVTDISDFSTNLSGKTRGKIKFALLAREKMADNLKFMINVMLNRGGIIETFISKKEALNWLKEKPKKTKRNQVFYSIK